MLIEEQNDTAVINNAVMTESTTHFDIKPELAEVEFSELDLDFTNTRNKLDPKVVLSLVENIKSVGLINPITVHSKVNGRYTVLAGFTRYEAIKILKHKTVLARVYEGLTTAQQLEISLSENTVRQDLSIPQQLIAMKRVITELGHADTATLANRLMWSKTHINSLLKVSRAPDCVLKALETGDIELGHATYLVQLLDIGGGDIEQNTALIEKTITKIKTEKWTVKLLKEKVISKHIPLNLAKFDTKQTCQGCEFNSSTYGSLFDFDNDDAMCTKPSCFQSHSETTLQNVKQIAEERFGNVILLSNVANAQVAPVDENVLGKKQITTCNTCADNIAIINDNVASATFIDVKDGLCRNNSCYKKCVNAYTKTQSTSSDKAPSVLTSSNKQSPISMPNDKAEAQVNLGQCTPKQKLLSQKAMSTAMLQRLNDTDVFQMLVCYAIQSISGNERSVPDAIKANELIATGNFQDAMQASYKLLIKYLSKCERNETIERNSPRSILLGLLANVADKEDLLKSSWDVSTQLETYTVKGILAICQESGFTAHFGEKPLAKLASGNKSVLLKAIIENSWSGWADYYPQSHSTNVQHNTIQLTKQED